MNYKDLEKYFRKKNVLITGHTGFKGSWLLTWLSLYKSNLMGMQDTVAQNSRPPKQKTGETIGSFFEITKKLQRKWLRSLNL